MMFPVFSNSAKIIILSTSTSIQNIQVLQLSTMQHNGHVLYIFSNKITAISYLLRKEVKQSSRKKEDMFYFVFTILEKILNKRPFTYSQVQNFVFKLIQIK